MIPGLLLLVIALLIPSWAQASPPSEAVLAPGPHGVGFRVFDVVDGSGDLGGLKAEGRPLRLFLWYPIRLPTEARPMVFGDYFGIPAARPELAPYYETLHRREEDVLSRQVSGKDAAKALQTVRLLPTRAHRDALPEAGKFPIVIHTLGRNDYQQESTVLWEYLAGHGYLVVVVPQMGRSLKRGGLEFSAKDMDLQARDVATALRHMARAPFADPDRIAVLGHSSGAVVAALLASRSNDIGALVSLDGSWLRADGREILDELNVDPASLSLPILDLYRASSKLDRTFVKQLIRCPVTAIRLGPAFHYDFQNWPLFASATGVVDDRVREFRSPEAGRDVYLAVCRLTLAFLEHTLRKNDRGLPLLRGEEPPVPGSSIRLRVMTP